MRSWGSYNSPPFKDRPGELSFFVVSDRLDDGAGGTDGCGCDLDDELYIHAVHPPFTM